MCRCWIGEDPDGGSCDSILAYHIDSGEIGGVDVSGLNYVQVVKIPGNVLVPKSWKRVSYLDARGSDAQQAAILDAWHGRLGGPLADFNELVGEDVAIETLPIDHDLKNGEGTLAIGDKVRARMAPYVECLRRRDDPAGQHLQHDRRCPGLRFESVGARREHIPEHGMVWTFKDRNAIQGDFRFEA